MMPRQHTIGKVVTVSSPTVSLDREVTLSLTPADSNYGIWFWRTDLERGIPCMPSFVNQERFTKWTCLESCGVRVEAIEHLMATLFALGIENVLISLDGPQIPLMDGSALPFAEMILEAGIVEQEVSRRLRYPVKKIAALWEFATDYITGQQVDRWSYMLAIPHSQFMLSYVLDYGNIALPQQVVNWKMDAESFVTDIAPARTFMTDWEMERWGPGSENPILGNYFCHTVPMVNEFEFFEPRIPNEAAKHKILDMLGDLSVLQPASGNFLGVRSGHSLNAKMVKVLCG